MMIHMNYGSLLAGILVLYLAGAFAALICPRNVRLGNTLSQSFSSMASLLGIYLSGSLLLQGPTRGLVYSHVLNVPNITITVTIDSLSAFFLLALSILTLAVSIYSRGYLSHYYHQRNVGLFNLLYNFFILTMISVMTSGNIIFFLISWEMMSLLSYFLVVFEGESRENQRAGLIYLIMTHIGTAFLVIAFMLLYQTTHSFDQSQLHLWVDSPVKNWIFIFLLVGFGTKAGVIPFHVWLPYAHPAAPSNVSALMSGIMIKTAVYGLMRFVLPMITPGYEWWGLAVLLIGTASTFLGVAYALMEHDIKRLLAYHSIENIGIIFIGLGLSFYARAAGNQTLCALSLAASLFHLLNHTVFKGALFLGAGSVHYATRTKDLEKLGGLMKKMPYTGFFILIASLAISAIPPFNGFVSEWLTYQALFANLSSHSTASQLLSIVAVAMLAMAGAMAAYCFVKLLGVAFLGLPRSRQAAEAQEVPGSMKTGMGVLVMLCLVLGVFPRPVWVMLDAVTRSLLGQSIMNGAQGGFFYIYFPLETTVSALSPLMVLLAGILLFVAVGLLVKLLGGKFGQRRYGTWDCGFDGLNARMQYSATGFTKPLRIVFRGLYRPTRELRIEEGASRYYPESTTYLVTTRSVFEEYIYAPLISAFTKLARKTRFIIQTGSIHDYLIYIFLTVVALLLYNGFNN